MRAVETIDHRRVRGAGGDDCLRIAAVEVGNVLVDRHFDGALLKRRISGERKPCIKRSQRQNCHQERTTNARGTAVRPRRLCAAARRRGREVIRGNVR